MSAFTAVTMFKSCEKILSRATRNAPVDAARLRTTTVAGTRPSTRKQTAHAARPCTAPSITRSRCAGAHSSKKGNAGEKLISDGALSPPTDAFLKVVPARLCISFDTTASMYPCIGEVKRKVTELVGRLLTDVPHMPVTTMRV